MSHKINRLAWNNRPLRTLSVTSKKTADSQYAIWLVGALAFITAFLFFLAPESDEIPTALLSSSIFFGVQIVCRECRPKLDNYMVPFNLAYLFFFIQLVIMPLTIAYFGMARGTLPWLPAKESTNAGLALYSLAYVSFALSFQFFSRRARRVDSQLSANCSRWETVYPKISIVTIGVTYVIIGLVGIYLFFGTPGTLVSYLISPISRFTLLNSLRGTLGGALATFFRPFLSFGLALLWAYWIDKYRMRTNRMIIALVTGIALAGLVVSGLAFSYNRGSVVIPLISLAAAFSNKVRRLSSLALILLALVSAGLISSIGDYRNVDNPYFEGTNTLSNVQVFGQAPQFLGFFLEETGFGRQLYWGTTLIASAMSPVPVLGKKFRPLSGLSIYNYLIYHNSEILDQIFPLQGELFANFYLIGVVVGYVLIGYVVCKLNRTFNQSINSFESYSWFMISYWVCYNTVLGSLAILSQELIVVFWPFYIYYILKFLNRKSSIRRGSL